MKFIRQMSGFTLIEAIVSLFVMLIILAISNQIFGYMQAVQPHLYQRQEQEWSFFTIYLEENFRNCRNVTVTTDGIKMDLLNIDEKGNRTWLPPGTNGTIIYNIGQINFQTTTLDLIYTISIEGSTRKRIVARAEEVTMTTENSESTTPSSESTVQETTEQMTSDTTVSKEE